MRPPELSCSAGMAVTSTQRLEMARPSRYMYITPGHRGYSGYTYTNIFLMRIDVLYSYI